MISNVEANHQNYFAFKDQRYLEKLYDYPQFVDLEKYYRKCELIKYRDLPIFSIELFQQSVGEAQITSTNDALPYIMPPSLFRYKGDMIKMRHLIHERTHSNKLNIWNAPKFGLKDLKINIDVEGKIISVYLDTHIIDYYDIVASSYSMDVMIKEMKKTIRDLYLFGPDLSPISEVSLPNNIGVDGLIFTSDNYLILQHRSSKTGNITDFLYSSVAGTVKDKPKYLDKKTNSLNVYTAFREQAREELGIEDFEMIQLIGGARILQQGGAVSLRFIGKIAETKQEFEERSYHNPPEDHWEYEFLEYIKLNGITDENLDYLYSIAQENYHEENQDLLLSLYFYEIYMKS